jgi:hypothetical protein
VVVAAIVGLALADLFSTFAAPNSMTGASAQQDVRIGSIVWQNAPQCKKLKFNNTNGRFSEDPSPCENENSSR